MRRAGLALMLGSQQIRINAFPALYYSWEVCYFQMSGAKNITRQCVLTCPDPANSRCQWALWVEIFLQFNCTARYASLASPAGGSHLCIVCAKHSIRVWCEHSITLLCPNVHYYIVDVCVSLFVLPCFVLPFSLTLSMFYLCFGVVGELRIEFFVDFLLPLFVILCSYNLWFLPGKYVTCLTFVHHVVTGC